MKVGQIMTKDELITIDKDQPVSTALELMERGHISALPVTDEDRLVGLCCMIDLVDRLGSIKAGKLTPANIHVSAVMEWKPKTVIPSTDVVDAARLLVERRERAVVVVEDEKIVGILTNTHFVKRCLKIDNLFVHDLNQEEAQSIHPQDRVIHARQMILTTGLPGLPVIDKHEVIGLVTKRRLALGFAAFRKEVPAKHQSKRLREFLVANILTRTNLTTHLEMTVGEAAELLLRNQQHILPVMKEGYLEALLIRRNLVELVGNKFQSLTRKEEEE
ncbi:MAG: HPP family protein [Promethearchaeota archaeon]